MRRRSENIPLTRPSLGQREPALLAECLKTGWLVQGPYAARFEEMFAAFTGADRAVAVSNCTTGLHLLLHALGLGPGDEVIAPSFTYVVLYTKGERPSLANLNRLNQERNQLMAAMEKDGIQVRQGTHAVHTLGYYAQKYGLRPEALPQSLLADRLSLTLPLFPGLTARQRERVVFYLSQPERFIACAA